MKAVAIVIGVALLALGLAGFVPNLNPDGMLFGFMPMNAVTSILFVVSGLAGIAIGMSKGRRLTPSSNVSSDDMRNWK